MRAMPAVVALAAVALATADSAAGSTTLSPAVTPSPAAKATMRLRVLRSHGHPRFVALGERLLVRGSVVPYLPGQRVAVHVYRDGRLAWEQSVVVRPAGAGAGQFVLGYTPARPGLISIRAVHKHTLALGAAAAVGNDVRVLDSSVAPGSSGRVVRLLQDELAGLHYAVPLSGVFDDATGRAVVAYRKMTSRALLAAADPPLFGMLQRGAGAFHVRYPHDGKHVEADLSKQVLAEIDRGGRVHDVYMMSSGKPSTPTVIGHFRVYLKTPGTNSEGMVDSNYFIGGYAIHGYPDVPTFAASHGCLRIPIPDAPSVFAWVKLGDAVDVYNDNGGGSHTVNGNAGP